MLIETKTNGSVLTVVVGGRLDALTAPDFGQAFNMPFTGLSEIVLNFESLEYVSSAGLREIISLKKRADSSGTTLKITHVSPVVLEILDITGFLPILTIE